jgi:hypothetical protein
MDRSLVQAEPSRSRDTIRIGIVVGTMMKTALATPSAVNGIHLPGPTRRWRAESVTSHAGAADKSLAASPASQRGRTGGAEMVSGPIKLICSRAGLAGADVVRNPPHV